MTIQQANKLYLHAKGNRKFFDANNKPIDIDKRIEEEKRLYRGGQTRYDKNNTEDTSMADCHRNICFEFIDSQIDVSIPLPKVTSCDKENDYQTKNIEDFLVHEIAHIKFQEIKNEADRLCRMHGTVFYQIYWDETISTPTSNGDIGVKVYSIEDCFPQPFVKNFDKIEYLFTRELVSVKETKKLYGVTIPEDGEKLGLNYLVTMWYYNDNDEVSKFGWIDNTEIVVFNEEGYQLRKMLVCKDCETEKTGEEKECLNCGNDTFKYISKEDETMEIDIIEGDPFTPDSEFDNENPRPNPEILVKKDTLFPYYKIDKIPFVCRINIPDESSLYGLSDIQFLKINQETLNTVNTKQVDNILDSTTFIMSSNKVKIDARKRGRVRHIKSNNPQDAQYMKAMRVDAMLQQDLMYSEAEYRSGQNVIGATDAFQGKRDYTATSGKAIALKTSNAASRFDSKKQMDEVAMAKTYEFMFKFMLAYCDEKRLFQADELEGKKQSYFTRYTFIDGTREYAYYNDRYLFETDSSTALAQDRAQLWQQTFQIYAQGALGQPGQPDTLRKLWKLLRKYNYPLAGTVLEYFAQSQKQLPQDLQQALMERPELLQQLMSQIQSGGVPQQNTLGARGGLPTPTEMGIPPQSQSGVRPEQTMIGGGTYGNRAT